MEKILLLLILIFSLLNINCFIDYNILNRSGGSFLNDDVKYTIRFYSNDVGENFSIQYTSDTIIDGIKYKRYNFETIENFFYTYMDFEYRMLNFNGFNFNVPFFPVYLVKDQKIYEEYENGELKYTYLCYVDSVKDVKEKYKDSYFITLKLNINIMERETILSEKYILNFDDGIIGFLKDDRYFLLDSIVY